jgi:2-methylcitrate dehydratase PrpD
MVEAVDCAATPLVVSSLPYRDPQNAVEARFSMQFCLAAAFLGKGEVKVTDFRDEKVRDPETIKMMKKINLRISPELKKKGFSPPDGPEAAAVEIALKGGKRYRGNNSLADWRPDNMPSWEALTKKYVDCASLVLSREKLERSIKQIQGLERLKTIRELITSIIR